AQSCGWARQVRIPSEPNSITNPSAPKRNPIVAASPFARSCEYIARNNIMIDAPTRAASDRAAATPGGEFIDLCRGWRRQHTSLRDADALQPFEPHRQDIGADA